ncbi:MAG: hypothetical protein QNI91_17680 [Arenicellales bacterium]|nr:hypothetical protein [Arenicellales bacterium]
MNMARLLCRMDEYVMREFSHRTTKALETHTLFRISFLLFRSLLEHNVQKEIAKDELVICHTAEVLLADKPVEAVDRQTLYQKSLEIDTAFLRRAALLPIRINIPYEAIEPVRKRRIDSLSLATYHLLERWHSDGRFHSAVKAQYSNPELCQRITEILHLYSLETQILSRAVRLPLLSSRDKLAAQLLETMERVGTDLAHELTTQIYDEKVTKIR